MNWIDILLTITLAGPVAALAWIVMDAEDNHEPRVPDNEERMRQWYSRGGPWAREREQEHGGE